MFDVLSEGGLHVDFVALVDPVTVDVNSGAQVMYPAIVLSRANATLQRSDSSVPLTLKDKTMGKLVS